jgi:hypothetical protein
MDAPVLISAPRMTTLEVLMPGADDAPRRREIESLMSEVNDALGFQVTDPFIGNAVAETSASRRNQCTRDTFAVYFRLD